MYYSDLVLKAANIMFEAHKNDKDKGGYPYVLHPILLASQMDDEDSTCVALLHDVVEDHADMCSFDSLKKEGFPDRIIDALKLLAHSDPVPYMDYIQAIAGNPVAGKVKIADLTHNTDLRRLNGIRPPKYDTYIAALVYLKSR